MAITLPLQIFPDGRIDEAGPPVPVVFVRSSWPSNYDADAVSKATGISFASEKMITQQQFKEESDINVIVERFGLTGKLPENGSYPVYGSFDEVVDYQTALNQIRAADEAFMALPGHVRARFGHDPQQLLEFCSDPANLEEARKLGLTKPLPSSDPVVDQDPVAAAPAAKTSSST